MEMSFSHPPPGLASSEMGILVGARGPDSPAQPGVGLAAPSNGHPPQLVGADRPPAAAHYRESEAAPAPENDLLGFL